MSTRKFEIGDIVVPCGSEWSEHWKDATFQIVRRYRSSLWDARILEMPCSPDYLGHIFKVEEKRIKLMKKTTREEIEATLAKAKEEVEDLTAKVAWMKATTAMEFDRTEYTCWKALQTLNSKSTDVEKAKVLAALLKDERK